MTSFAQVVIGLPGSGKSTYCAGAAEILTGLGRPVKVVNLDPANEAMKYETAVDICELITVEEAMDELELGPNGALLYCMEYLADNKEWLRDKLAAAAPAYFLLDLPGQVEVYTACGHLARVLHWVARELDVRMASVHLCDVTCIADPGKFISASFTALSAMLNVELPAVNLLSKVDLLRTLGRLALPFDAYVRGCDFPAVLDLLRGLPSLDRYRRLNEAVVEMLEDTALVAFTPVSVTDGPAMLAAQREVDTALGYTTGALGELGGKTEQEQAQIADLLASAPPPEDVAWEAERTHGADGLYSLGAVTVSIDDYVAALREQRSSDAQ
eukprot:gnl/Chilomastix_cuspidata/3816.p1 GENE.gnl/Chilomastix_cuspidata/3816~~gnl/Chilomastix_cuspidata/3816.p1  ORF type:complete len:328 (-),score=98.96 gnl/Chilomastix_cuspidata/3816:76-1059(-)